MDQTPPPSLNPEAVILTPQLVQRPCRPANLFEENKAFHELARCLALHPEQFLDRLVEVTLQLCDADTVGISVEATDDEGKPIFRWAAIAGDLKQMVGRIHPKKFQSLWSLH
jgi:hypothetical protein